MNTDNEETPAEGWASLDGLAQVRRAKAEMAGVANSIDDVLAAPFLAEPGRRMLELLVERIVNRPSWNPGETLDAAYYREGQKDIVQQLVAAVNRVQARKAAGGSTQA